MCAFVVRGMSLRRFTDKPPDPVEKKNEALSKVLLAGLENDRLRKSGAPSKADGFAAYEEGTKAKKSPVKSTATFEMVAGNLRENGKFSPAASFDDADGIQVTMEVACVYSIENTSDGTIRSAVVKNVVNGLASVATNLFTEPLRTKLRWQAPAEAVKAEVAEKTGSKLKDPKEFSTGHSYQYNSTVTATRFVPFDNQFDIDRLGDPRQASAMKKEFDEYTKTLVDTVVASKHAFGTVCSKGMTIEVELDRVAQEMIADTSV